MSDDDTPAAPGAGAGEHSHNAGMPHAAHRCGARQGKLFPYPALLCSLCKPGESVDVTSGDLVAQLAAAREAAREALGQGSIGHYSLYRLGTLLEQYADAYDYSEDREAWKSWVDAIEAKLRAVAEGEGAGK